MGLNVSIPDGIIAIKIYGNQDYLYYETVNFSIL